MENLFFSTYAGYPVGDPVNQVSGSYQNAKYQEVDEEPCGVQSTLFVT